MSVAAPPFLFIRHGETDWNAEGRLQGQLDIPLNATGRAQAAEAGRRAAELLRKRGRDPAAAPFTASPLGRTRDTVERARVAMGLPAEGYAIDDRLKEFTFGAWEGLTWKELAVRDRPRLTARRRDKWGFVPPGGESYAMLAERVRPWLDTVAEDAVAVSHGGVARVLMVMLTGLSPEAAAETEVLQGRVLVFGDGRFRWG